MATLHLVCGLPGAGKTTLARKLEAAGEGMRLSPDEWMSALEIKLYDEAGRERVEALQWSLGQELLSKGVSVILENGFWSRAERDTYRSVAAARGAATRIHHVSASLGELKRRIVVRNAGLSTGATVDPDDLDAWATLFEPPSDDELRG